MPQTTLTARNKRESGFTKAAAAFEFHCECVHYTEKYRKRLPPYEPPAAPDVTFPQQADYSPKPSSKPMPTHMNFTTRGPNELVHKSCPDYPKRDWSHDAMLWTVFLVAVAFVVKFIAWVTG